MPTYFHGWRQKLGVVTLVMACVFMGGWMRSIYSTDMIVFQRADGRDSLVSGSHGLAWHETGRHMDDETDYDGPPFEFLFNFSQPLDLDRLLRTLNWQLKSSFCGFATLEFTHSDAISDRIRIVPYWSIVIPLTLLSAYLLLSKSRSPHPKKITDPIHVDGA